METANEWIHLLIRWLHITTGIAWIGASFYFNWLNHSLEPPSEEEKRNGIGGKLSAIHGGGFYFVQLYKVAPAKLPEKLHWFKWEAYMTWISGIALLSWVYYMQADSYLLKPDGPITDPTYAILLGLGSLLLAWFIYDVLCDTLLQSPTGLFIIGLVIFAGFAYAYSFLFAGRAAYIHAGAMIGTIMTANVFRVIIPMQKEMVDAMTAGQEPDSKKGERAKMRSLHNNYLTLPVLFVMISNHYPFAFGHPFNWAMLFGIAIISAMIRHWFNLKGRGEKNIWILPVGAIAMIALAFAGHHSRTYGRVGSGVTGKVQFSEVKLIVDKHCRNCHSAAPSDNVFTTAPQGVMYDTAAQIKAMAAKIKQRSVETQSMPLGNKTKMTADEREILGAWIDQGAKTN